MLYIHDVHSCINGWRGWLWWEFGHLFCIPDTDDVKQKNNSLETIPSRFSLNRKQKSFAFRHLCPVHEVLSGILEFINIWTNCQMNTFGPGKCTFDCQSGNFKNYSSGNHVSTRSCMLRIEKLINFNMTCRGHFIQIHSCMGICFSCMYTNNCEHFHKWFGSLYRDNSVLMRVS